MTRAPGLVRPHETKFDVVARLFDAGWIVAALVVVVELSTDLWLDHYGVAATLAAFLFQLVGHANGLYRSARGEALTSAALRVWRTWAVVVPLLLLAAFVTKTSSTHSRLVFGLWFVLAPAMVSGWRLAVRIVLDHARTRGYNTRRAAVAGVSEVGERLAANMTTIPWMGLEFTGFYDDRPLSRLDSEAVGHLRGTFDDLVEHARRGECDIVYVALPPRAERRITELLGKLSDTTASVYWAYDFGGFDLLRAQWSSIGEIPVVSAVENPFRGVDGWLKRLEDIVLASIILAVVAVPMTLIGLAVKATSRGPVFFRQRRYGLNGETITVLKFRTMTVCEDGDHVPQARKDDARVTSLGRFLRRTSLDELPQLLQVVTGTMSIVGPRPHAVPHNEHYRGLIKGYMLRHKVKPGITGWAQVNGWRGETETLDKMEGRVKHDLAYIRHWALRLDMKILLLTIIAVVRGKNAY